MFVPSLLVALIFLLGKAAVLLAAGLAIGNTSVLELLILAFQKDSLIPIDYPQKIQVSVVFQLLIPCSLIASFSLPIVLFRS